MNNPRNIHQRRSFKDYVNEQMKESLIAGVPEIANCESSSRRAVKSIMFLFCTAGCIYQTCVFLESFLKFETIQNFRIEYPAIFMAPAVTFCNKNRINRELFCPAVPKECFWYESVYDICEAEPNICETRNYRLVLGVPRNTSQIYHNHTNEFLDAYGPQSAWEYITHTRSRHNCKSQRTGVENRCRDNDSILIQAPSGGLPYKCFSLFSLLGKPYEKPKNMSMIGGYSFIVRTLNKQLMNNKHHAQVYMHVHDPRHLTNPISEGITLDAGYVYTFFFKMQRIQNLPPPYITYCVDYLKKWKENGGRGPLTKKDCIELCKIEKMMEQYSCVEKSITHPHRFPICSEIITISNKVMEDCSSGCRAACDVTLYTIAGKHKEENYFRGSINVNLKFSQLSVQRIYMEPKFQNIELFSYIGGFMGLWLGVCLVTFVDFLETVTDVIFFAAMKWKNRHQIKSIRLRFLS